MSHDLELAAHLMDEAPHYRASPSVLDRLRARRKTWLAIRGLREIVVIGAVYVLYDLTRYVIAGDHYRAVVNARSLIAWESSWHLDPEHYLNTVFSAHVVLGLPADYIYATMHYIITPAVLIWLWRRYPESYGPARTVLIVTTVIGLVGFSTFPVAPPRLFGGYIDTMAKFSHYGWWSTAGSAPRGLGSDTNQYAAFPSLHVGWALWAGWQLYRHGQHRLTRLAGIAYPILTAVVVVATGNHYLIDVFAGVAVVGLGALGGWLITTTVGGRNRPSSSASGPPAPA
ncbi:MAG TPA: phosphatase PAP2 family protein [Mycobacteriales bacterium]|nr:phosphatase PAP2 family protein [Mycobacteriales bacterium]